MEDSTGNTLLFYRILSKQESGNVYSGANNIYKMIPGTETDTLFLVDDYSCFDLNGYGISVSDFDFWHNNENQFIYTGTESNCFEGWGYISRFDSGFVWGGLFESFNRLFISNQNDSLIYASPFISKSSDGGFNWVNLNDSMSLQSLSPFDENIFFSTGPYRWWGTTYLYKTTNSGISFQAVDTVGLNDEYFYYDTDGDHVYRKFASNYPNYSLKSSAFQGNAFTWQTIYSTNKEYYLSLNPDQSGEIYLADGKKIFRSNNYGSTFNLYKELDKSIIGIYKKPNIGAEDNKLYAASRYNLYEVSDDTVSIIKSLPIPQEIFSYYPLQTGNKWFYKRIDYSQDPGGWQTTDTSYFTRFISGSEIKPNGNVYYRVEDKNLYTNDDVVYFERIDSLTGKIFRFNEFDTTFNQEYLIDNLWSEIDDIIYSGRISFQSENYPMLYQFDDYFTDFNLTHYKVRKNFISLDMGFQSYTLTEGIGLDSMFLSVIDLFNAYIDLKGCIINGIAYGDTTLTNIGETQKSPIIFSLSQNFPNPFNPSTTIKYEVSSRQFVVLKVYDLLGREVVTLINEEKPAGSYEIEFDAGDLASGIYYYQLKAGDPSSSSGQSFIQTKKMILLK
ncbi:MAG: T9SS type A sorting domain-containing protein [Ignavibacteriales bacterium]|nr:MAG: T9SS type A sorting domain-containing protein [Ignavibacteriales bacterium]